MDEKTKERFFAKTKRATEIRPGMATPCLEWQAGRSRSGYGKFSRDGKTERAHRVAWEMANGPIPDGLNALHKCDNRPCVDDTHLFLGTIADNNADMVAKGRQAIGDMHGARLHPERMARGSANGARLHPESRPRGATHGLRLHPERIARGDRNGARLHPERMPRGESHASAKLTEDNVRFIFHLRGKSWSQRRLAAEFGVDQALIGRILNRKVWKHVEIVA